MNEIWFNKHHSFGVVFFRPFLFLRKQMGEGGRSSFCDQLLERFDRSQPRRLSVENYRIEATLDLKRNHRDDG